TDRFYVVIASFQSEGDAQKEAKKYKDIEGSNIRILKNNQGQFRVSINNYPNLDEAKQGKKQYSNSFNGAWILNY
ncbi:MAG: SPOR domain-containing protein, partial [Bacteroidales bacterium]|nr:SPOR domain-containing protein [Bacteroidales bacterium]